MITKPMPINFIKLAEQFMRTLCYNHANCKNKAHYLVVKSSAQYRYCHDCFMLAMHHAPPNLVVTVKVLERG